MKRLLYRYGPLREPRKSSQGECDVLGIGARDVKLYFGHWQTLAIGIILVAFGFEGIRIINIVSNPYSYSMGVLLGAIVGFVAHETAHREVARRQGCLAGFVLTTTGVTITLISGVLRTIGLPIAILAPGYVTIICQSPLFTTLPRREDLISGAGPAANIAIAYIAYLLLKLAKPEYQGLLAGIVDINAWLAFFNLLPLPPLDGSKLARENVLAWIALLVAALILMT